MQEGRRGVKAAAAIVVWLACAPVGHADTSDPGARPPASGEPPLFVVDSPAGFLTYEPGRGLAIGDHGLRLGGYTSLSFVRDEGEPARASFDELSFFGILDPHPRFHLFTELEFEHLLHVSTDGDGSVEETHFDVERAYGDVRVSDALSLRAGKFLTPVGRWNVIHAEPLVWTTSRPITTTLPFDDYTTGVQAFGTFALDAATVTTRLFGQFTDALEPVSQAVAQERSGGGRLELELRSGPELGATILAFRSQGRWAYLGGLDALWSFGANELHAELVVGDEGGAPAGGSGGFVQFVRELVPRWYAIGRYEAFDPRDASARSVHLFDVGAAFRPLPTLILKAEYLFADRASAIAEPGFKSSVSLLF